MANIQVMRFETKAELGAQVQLVQHIDGTTRPETASDPSIVSVHEPVELGAIEHLGGQGMAAARSALDAILATRSKKGRPPKQCVDFLFAGPPPYGEPGAWAPARELEWANAEHEALRELVGPNSIIVTHDLHRDETSPHTQSLVVPIDSQGRLGWCHVRDEACKRLRPELDRMRDEAEKLIAKRRAAGEDVPDLPPPSTKSRYGLLQDWLYYRVSRRFGLERGVVGSEATHEQIDRTKAAEAAAERAERNAKEAEVRAELAEVERGAAQRHAEELAHDNRIDSVLEKVREEKLDHLRASADAEVERTGEAARVRSELVAEVRTLAARRDATRVELDAEDRALAHRRDVASMLPGAARVVAEHEWAAVRSARVDRALRVRRLRTSERIRRRERDSEVRDVEEAVSERRRALDAERTAIRQRESAADVRDADLVLREEAVGGRESAAKAHVDDLDRREKAVAAGEGRVRAGFAGVLHTAGDLLRSHRRVLGRLSAWAQRLIGRSAELDQRQADLNLADQQTATIIQGRLTELAQLDDRIARRRVELGVLERCAAVARTMDAGGVFGVLREEFARDGVQLSPRLGPVLDGCATQRSPAPLLESRRVRELHEAHESARRRQGKGEGRA